MLNTHTSQGSNAVVNFSLGSLRAERPLCKFGTPHIPETITGRRLNFWHTLIILGRVALVRCAAAYNDQTFPWMICRSVRRSVQCIVEKRRKGYFWGTPL